MQTISLLGGLSDTQSDCIAGCAALSSNVSACSAQCKVVYPAQVTVAPTTSTIDTSWYTQWWGLGLILAVAVGGAWFLTKPKSKTPAAASAAA